jgi:FSR family fosmidomycin resistance protein-like MFS transporter
MFKRLIARSFAGKKITWSALSLTFLFLLIEFFDELHYGVQNAVLPSMRADLALTYAQVGLLLGLPKIINTFIEPTLMLLGDSALRKRLVVGGGLVITGTLLVIAATLSFPALLLAFIVVFPASGAFVTLAQATLMDLNPGREPHMMARWTVAGSLGNLIGPLLIAGGFALALGWRWAYVMLAGLALGLVLSVMPRRFPQHASTDTQESVDLRKLLRYAWEALRNLRLLRWLGLLEMSDLMLDVFSGYVALYFADVVRLSPAQVGVLLAVLMFTSLVADLVLIPLLERFSGRRLVRASAVFVGLVYIAWLLAPWLWAKLLLVVVIRFSTLGWYQVLQGEAYATIPGRSGTVMAVNSLAGVFGGALAWLVGWIASQAGLPIAMWLLLLGPLSLALFTPPPRI